MVYFDVHVTHVRIQDSIPTEITCFKKTTFKTPFLQKCTSKMFFFFQTLPSYTKHTFSLAEWAIPWRLILQTSRTTKDWLTDSVEILAKWDVQNTLTPHLRIYHSSMVCWCLSVYSFIYIYISFLFGERDDIHIFYTVNCCIQRMYPWLETQPLKFSSSSPSYRNCDSVCLSSLQSIPWRGPNKQRHTRKSTFAAHVGAIQSLNVLIFV